MEPILNEQPVGGPGDAPPAVVEECYWMMSLALDGLLDAPDRARFEEHLAAYPSVAALWREWQQVHSHLDALPHAEPAPGFVVRFEQRLAAQEAAQQQQVLTWSIVAAVVVALGALFAMVGTGVYIMSAHGAWLGAQLHNLVYTSVAVDTWFDALADSFFALASTPQAQALGMMYVIVAIIMIFGWVQLLRRSARLSGAVALPGME
jgi:anti-sigma factor RsiW